MLSINVSYATLGHKLWSCAKQVYVEVAPLPQLPEALFLTAFAGRDNYAYNRPLALLERAARRAPDALALAAGMAAMLRQFHPAYTRVRKGLVGFASGIFWRHGPHCRVPPEDTSGATALRS